MEFTDEFTVPTDIDTAWSTLIDLEMVAPCLPGATLEEVEGATYTGRVKVKVGPITVSYRGTAELIEVDGQRYVARIAAKGKETRGAGTANADVRAELTPSGEGTRVEVVTDLEVTGKPAQFGRGVMEEVGTKIIRTFAERLEILVTTDDISAGTTAAITDLAATAPGADGERRSSPHGEPGALTTPRTTVAPGGQGSDDVLDLMEFAGGAAAKRVLPIVAAITLIAGIIWWLSRR